MVGNITRKADSRVRNSPREYIQHGRKWFCVGASSKGKGDSEKEEEEPALHTGRKWLSRWIVSLPMAVLLRHTWRKIFGMRLRLPEYGR